MPFVVDSSVAAGWVLPDEANEAVTALGRRLEDAPASVPDLFWHEMRNLLILACRRERIDPDLLLQAIRKIERLPLQTTTSGDAVAVVQLALKHRLTAYDAAYLVLALSERRALATLDQELRAAASAEGVTVLPEGAP